MSLCAQDLAAEGFEVIVVDDGGIDDSARMAARLKTPYPLRYLRKAHGGQGAARNLGARSAQGLFILFIDDDVRADSSLLAEHLKMHSHRRDVVVQGRVLPLNGTGWLNSRISSFINGASVNGGAREFNAVTANLSLSGDHFRQSGGFDESYEDYGFEDTEWGFRLVRLLGLSHIFARRAIVYHDNSLRLRDSARNQFRIGRALVKSLRKDPAILAQQYSRQFREETFEHLAETGRFIPLTLHERNSLIREMGSLERRARTGRSARAEAALSEKYDRLLKYTYEEGVYTARQGLNCTRSIFEDPDPSRALIGIPLTLFTLIDPMSGYGTHSRNLISELTRRGFRIEAVDARNTAAVNARRTVRGHEPVAVISLTPPHLFRKVPGAFNIGYTTHETTRLPPSWVEPLNSMDEIWVVSAFNERAFRQSGVKPPIFVMPHGLNPREFRPLAADPPVELYGNFTFLSMGSFYFYKGFDLALRAFIEEFRADEDVCLILKVYRYVGYDPTDIRGAIEEIAKKAGHKKLPRIVLLENTNFPSVVPLYSCADAYVCASRGEGFCLPLLESLACQVPVIAHDFGGQSDFLTRENSFLVDYDLRDVRSNDHSWHTEGQWAWARIEHLRETMRFVYEHPGDARKKALRGFLDFRSRWTLKHAGDRLAARLYELFGS